MKTRTRLFSALSIILLFFLTSCASTKVTNEWKDPSFSSQKFKKIMVLGVAKQPRNRKLYEDKFVQHLAARGVTAIASHTLIPHEDMREKAKVVQNIQGLGIDGVIVTRVRDIKEKQKGGRQSLLYEHYNESFTFVSFSSYNDGGTPNRKQKFSFESKLYDVITEKPVFSLSSDTIAQDNIKKRLDSYINIVVSKMAENDLL